MQELRDLIIFIKSLKKQKIFLQMVNCKVKP